MLNHHRLHVHALTSFNALNAQHSMKQLMPALKSSFTKLPFTADIASEILHPFLSLSLFADATMRYNQTLRIIIWRQYVLSLTSQFFKNFS